MLYNFSSVKLFVFYFFNYMENLCFAGPPFTSGVEFRFFDPFLYKLGT